MKTIEYDYSQTTELDRNAVLVMLKKLQNLYLKCPGAHNQMQQFIGVFENLDLLTDTIQEPTKTLFFGQTREKDVDTAKAKALQFGFGEALDIPLFWYRDPITGKKVVLFGNHRLWKGKVHLKADSMPAIEITLATAGMSPELLGAVGKLHNSKSRKENESSLEEDSRASLQATRAWMRERPDYKNILDEDEIKRILSDKEVLKLDHPSLWSAIQGFADISLVNSKTEIINHMLSNNDDHRPYTLGKSDAVYGMLKNVFGEGSVNKVENTIHSVFFNDGQETVISLADGTQQQEQGWLRIMKKRIANQRVVPVINGIGNSKSAIISSRIKAFELMLLVLHFEGLSEGMRSLRSVYNDGILLFPNFKEGLKDTNITVGKKKYSVSIDPERDDSYEDFKIVEIDEILRALVKVYVREKVSFEEQGEVKLTSFPQELAEFIFPTLQSLIPVEKKRHRRKERSQLGAMA